MKKEIIKIGTKTKHLGIIEAVLWIGERYYMLLDKKGCVSLMPEKDVLNDLTL